MQRPMQAEPQELGTVGTIHSPCPAPMPGNPARESPRRKEGSHEMDLRWLLGSLRVLLSVEGNKGKASDTDDKKREARRQWDMAQMR